MLQQTNRIAGILVALFVIHVVCIVPPDVSLSTIPVGYFGGQNSSHRSQENLEMLAKMRMIVIEKWEGPCWDECLANATKKPPLPCQASCGADKYQESTINAARAINPKLSVVFYLNTLYDFGFISLHEQALAIGADVVKTDGKLLTIKNDNGMPGINAFDQGKKKTRDMWLKFLADKKVDGVFPDKATIRAQYNKSSNIWQLCEYNNGKTWDISCGEISEADANAYNEGKELLMDGIYELFGKEGFIFHNTTAEVTHVGKRSPSTIINDVQNAFKSGALYVYFMVHDHATNQPPTTESTCTQRDIILFLLAVEEGCILGCDGWDPQFEKPLGNPLGPATVEGDVYTRKFASGTSVTWNTKTDSGDINWAN